VRASLTERLAGLYRIGQLVNSSLVLDEVLNLVIDNLVALTGAERGFIMLFDTNGELVIRAARTSEHFAVGMPHFYETSRNIIREVALSGKPRLIMDASGESEYQAYQSVVAYFERGAQDRLQMIGDDALICLVLALPRCIHDQTRLPRQRNLANDITTRLVEVRHTDCKLLRSAGGTYDQLTIRVEEHDEAALSTGQCDQVVDDQIQHLVQYER
jgi:hypothetical protein